MRTRPTQKQLTFLDELFQGHLDEEQLLNKHKISRSRLNRWKGQPAFIAEFENRIESLNRQTLFLIATYSSLAAARLVSLTESENQETSRKACLDILSLTKKIEHKNPVKKSPAEQTQSELSLSPELAEKLLAVIASEK